MKSRNGLKKSALTEDEIVAKALKETLAECR
jgi:hypothetical protein